MAYVGKGPKGYVYTGKPSLPPSFLEIGTNSGLTNHGVLIAAGDSAFSATSTGSTGQVLQSGGAAADPIYSSAAYPSTAGTSGNVITSDGTNFTSTVPSYYVIATQCAGFSPADGSTTYISPDSTSTGNSVSKRFVIPRSGRITACFGTYSCTAGASNESATIDIFLNGTTATNVTTSLDFSVTSGGFNSTALNITVAAGDVISFRLVGPTWATNPTNVRIAISCWIEV